jgi:hypothetical protein
MSENIKTPARKMTWPMLGVSGAIFAFGCVWAVSVFSTIVPSRADPSRRTQTAAPDAPQVYVYIANNGGESKPPTVLTLPQPALPAVEPREPPQPHFGTATWPEPHPSPLLQKVQLPVYQPNELPQEGIFGQSPYEAYRNQFPNACRPNIWNPNCQPVEDGGWEEVRRVPEHLNLPRLEQWTKVGSYLCIQHESYYDGHFKTRCWQRT